MWSSTKQSSTFTSIVLCCIVSSSHKIDRIMMIVVLIVPIVSYSDSSMMDSFGRFQKKKCRYSSNIPDTVCSTTKGVNYPRGSVFFFSRRQRAPHGRARRETSNEKVHLALHELSPQAWPYQPKGKPDTRYHTTTAVVSIALYEYYTLNRSQ